MTNWLPSLNALRAFEVVCRHLNYAHAAAEPLRAPLAFATARRRHAPGLRTSRPVAASVAEVGRCGVGRLVLGVGGWRDVRRGVTGVSGTAPFRAPLAPATERNAPRVRGPRRLRRMRFRLQLLKQRTVSP